MIEIYLLQQLVAFAECGTLTAAAKKLHTSQPALTRSMKKLEDELGISLFVRSKNHLTLNETGQIAAEYALRVLKENEYFQEKVAAFDRSLHTLNIGYCAPIPQIVFTPLINALFEGLSIAADMRDDADFLKKLEMRTYQLAVVHEKPPEDLFYSKKCGHEDLYMSLRPSDPLTFYPELHLRDLDGRSILLLTRIGFWTNITKVKTPHTRYLLQIEQDTFWELAAHSDYPIFMSSYYIKRKQDVPGRINVALADAECHTDYYLVCLKSEQKRFQPLFDKVHENTVT